MWPFDKDKHSTPPMQPHRPKPPKKSIPPPPKKPKK